MASSFSLLEWVPIGPQAIVTSAPQHTGIKKPPRLRILKKRDGYVKQSIVSVKACFSGMYRFKMNAGLLGRPIEIWCWERE